jgi:cytoskeletal protein CcmA (bactofilin family)
MARLLSSFRRRSSSESGMAMILAMTVTFVVFTLGAVWIGLGTHQVTATGREKLRDQARNAAEAGVNLAMSRLSSDSDVDEIDLTAIDGGEFEVDVLPVGIDPADPRRYIIARGYAPTKANPNRQARRLEQQVELAPTDGFRYALFTHPGGISGNNNLTVNGDVYAADDLTLAQHSTVSGSVAALGSVTTSNNTTILGDINALENVTLNQSTTVLGNVYAGGNVTMSSNAHVKGNVQAGGTISSNGTVDGSRSQNSPPVPPAPQTLPEFDWTEASTGMNPLNEYLNPTAFKTTYWATNRTSFKGAHHIKCPVGCSSVDFDNKWTLVGDTTIYADGPVTLNKDIANANPLKDANGTSLPLTLTIVSDAVDNAVTGAPAIKMTNNVTVPDNIKVVFFAQNGTVKFEQLKHFTGTVYAKTIDLSQQFTLTFKPLTPKGFNFGFSASEHFSITANAFKEVPFS